jgi:hypothetical protein
MRPSSFLTRHRGPKWAVALGGFLLAGACNEGSRNAPVAPASFEASSNSLPHYFNPNIPIPASMALTLSADDCSNNPGPFITLEGVTVLGGFGVEMSFTNNMKATHEYTAENVVDVLLDPSLETITIPKQPVLGGTGGNPFIWIQFVDAAGTPTSPEYFIGRCVQGGMWGFNQVQSATGAGSLSFAAISCENSPGPYITFDAGISLGGVGVQVIFRNNDNPVGGPHEATRSSTLTIIPDGLSFTFPKQPVLGGVGGNPWIWAAFTDGDGTVVGEQNLVGRCEQLSKLFS